MKFKAKLGMGVASAALGLSLIGGGTIAYFSDKEVTDNTFAAGKLDLSINPSTVINMDNIKPGDTLNSGFQLINSGTLDIKEVLLATDYTVEDAKGDNNGADFGEHIKVKFFWNLDKSTQPVFESTLADLKKATAAGTLTDLVKKGIVDRAGEGLPAGSADGNTFYAKFEFVDNNQDQNVFQGDKLKVKWSFTATQTAGEDKEAK